MKKSKEIKKICADAIGILICAVLAAFCGLSMIYQDMREHPQIEKYAQVEDIASC